MSSASTSKEDGKQNGGPIPPKWNFTSGFISGLFSITATYPLHKIMFRQMSDGLPLMAAVEQVRKEGVYMLYRGVLSPLGMRATSLSIMFGSYHSYRSWMEHHTSFLNKHVIISASAALAGVSEACLFVPFERVQALLLDKKFNLKFHNTVHTVGHLWKHYPVKEFYRGASAVLFRNSFANVLYFTSREHVDKIMPREGTAFTIFIIDFINGGVIGALNSTLYYPVNVVKTRMQTRVGGPFESPREVFLKIYNERGRRWHEMYRGVHMNYTRSMLSWGITTASFEMVRRYMDDIPKKES